jgi:hypothetical protein
MSENWDQALQAPHRNRTVEKGTSHNFNYFPRIGQLGKEANGNQKDLTEESPSALR